ncbi:MAG: SIS domain-containing protein, partial [Candidatus Omnitrophica bacterium]|nr:SIS domain-containing protein [Candidatus Omnitrophota bacterium]
MEIILKEINRALARVKEEDWQTLGQLIAKPGRIFVAGAGRSGMIGRCFAIRLRHLGKESYVAGESICPPVGKKDTLVVISCSGKTKSTLGFAQTAALAGSRV